jgi:hypothetical protein
MGESTGITPLIFNLSTLLQILLTLLQGKAATVPIGTGGWFSPTAGLNVSETRKISGLYLGLKHDCSVIQPNA